MLDNKIVDGHFAHWRSAMTPSGETNRQVAESAICDLYRQLGEEPPSIIWCQSLYQFVTLPSLLLGMLHSDLWHAISTTLVAAGLNDQEWERKWDEAWQNHLVHFAAPLIAGMNRTSRIGEQYGYLQDALITHAKRELGQRLRSGQIRKFAAKLKREVCRRTYWATQAWVPALAREHASRFTREFVREIEFHKRDYQVDWQYFGQVEAEVHQFSRLVWGGLDALVSRMGAEPAAQMRSVVWLPFMMPLLSTCTFWRNELQCDFAKESEALSVWLNLCDSASGVICVQDIAFVCERPLTFTVNDRGRPHNDSGPALTYSDGFALYAWHGVIVDPDIIEHPESITLERIETTANAETRRVMIERYGTARYLQESGAEAIQEDDFGVLYRKEMAGDEPLLMVKVVNSTPEPDGTFKDYFLRVPPHMTTAREAVAWTFGFEGGDGYEPLKET